MAPQIERLSESFSLGEGPHWDVASQKLYFLDCREKILVRYDPSTKKITKASTAPKQPSFIIPVEGKKDHFLISLNKELVIITWDGESDKFIIIEKLGIADDSEETRDNKFNDGKCDSSGRLWAGTFNIIEGNETQSPPVGTLYSFDSKRKLKAHVNKVRISNGIAFNNKTKKMFYIDSLKGTVDRFGFDLTNGSINNREAWFTFNKHNIPGSPDGMTIDTDGNLWVAVFGGARVLRIDGNKSESLLDTIRMPAIQITSVSFGGQNLDELYVTSACIKYRELTPEQPVNGALYRITGIGATGLPANNFKLG